MDKNRITGTARQVAGRLKSIAGNAGHDAALRAEGAYEEAAGYGGRLVGQARDQVRYLADEGYDVGQRLYDDGLKTLQRQASAHPIALVLAAGVAGAALAWLFTSSSSRR